MRRCAGAARDSTVNLGLAAGRAAWSTVFPGAEVALLVGMAAASLGGNYKVSMLLFALLLVLPTLLLAVLAAACLHTWQ